MTNILALCPACGQIAVPAALVRLTLHDDGSPAVFAYPCPKCGDVVIRHADPALVHLLLSAPEIAATAWHLPRRARVPKVDQAGRVVQLAPLTGAAIDAFARDLDTIDDIVEAVERAR